jgi:hypothetical protein
MSNESCSNLELPPSGRKDRPQTPGHNGRSKPIPADFHCARQSRELADSVEKLFFSR